MKYLLGTIALLAAAAAATGFVCYRMGCDPAVHEAAARGDAMAWLRTDFHLTDAQFAAIRQLHESYSSVCDEHCRAIREAAKARDALKAARPDGTTAIAAAEHRVQELRSACERAITRHVEQVAALMTPAEGRRYLALVRPKIAGFDHAATPDLHLNHH
ncbi:MAG: hypothetical protein PHQ04_06290 [Opitutaceae bacterium]|nr:hypothetical protein [Opitutaceae bacterium]